MRNNRPTTFHQHLLSAAISSALLFGANGLHAQSDAQSLSGVTLEEIVVTARKRSENLQDIPMAVSAIDSSELAINGVSNLGDIQAQVPGLTAYAARGTTSSLTAYIRGVGQSDPLWGVEPGVGLYLDGVYIARPQGALLEVFDVDRIEVLRGPQGTLYGRNTIGGAIKYVSKPVSQEPTGKIQATLGSDGRQDLVASYASPLIEDELFANVAIASLSHDGLGENRLTGSDLSDKQVLSARLALEWHASDTLQLKFAADATKDTSAPRGGQRMLENNFESLLYTMINQDVAPFFSLGGFNAFDPAAVVAFATANPSALPVSNNRYDTHSGQPGARNDVNTSGGSLTIDYTLHEQWQLKSITAYREGDTEGTIDFDLGPLPIGDVWGEYDDHQLTQEFQFNYDNGDDWQAVIGLYYIDANAGGDVRNQFLLPLTIDAADPANPIGVTFMAPIALFNNTGGEVETTSYSLYGEANWQVTERLNLFFGGRYNWENKDATIQSFAFSDATFSTIIGTETDFEDDETWTNFSPKVGLDYQWNDDTLVYASISRGFKSGGFNIRARQATEPESVKPYDEEIVTAYELGLKTSLADRVQINVAYFHSDYEDIQLSIFSQAGDGTFFGDFTNAGEGVIQGVELEFVAAVTEALNVSGNVTYLDTEYKEFLDRGVDIADQQEFTNTPQWTATLNTTYSHFFANGSEFVGRLTYSYRDDVIPTTDLSDIVAQEGYDTVDATLAYTSADGQWRVALEGRNLTDEEYRTTGYDLRNSGFPIVQGFYGNPRSIALKVGYEF